MSPGVAQVRADICAACPTPCAFRADPVAHATPAASCLLTPPRWSAWGAKPSSQAIRQTAAASSVHTFARRIRGYAAAGLLVIPARRRHRRDICAACPHAVATPHRGLYRCAAPAARCGCIGGDEVRLALLATTCPLARW